jgi:hypothetical protein
MDILKNGYFMNMVVVADNFFGHPIHPIFGAVFTFSLVTTCSTLIIYLANKIPFLNKVIK